MSLARWADSVIGYAHAVTLSRKGVMMVIDIIEGASVGYLVWCSSLDRARLGLIKGDITAALDWFREQTGQVPAVIRLHPKCAHLAGEVPAGIEVEYRGALAWEIQLSLVRNPALVSRLTGAVALNASGAEKAGVVSNDLPRNMSTLAAEKIEVDIIPPPVATGRLRRGPKAKALPVALVTQWAAEGMGSKAITTRLRAERGIEVSYKTIQRVISGERPLFK